MRPVLQIRLVKRPTSLISSDQLCQLSNFIRPVCHAMRLGWISGANIFNQIKLGAKILYLSGAKIWPWNPLGGEPGGTSWKCVPLGAKKGQSLPSSALRFETCYPAPAISKWNFLIKILPPLFQEFWPNMHSGNSFVWKFSASVACFFCFVDSWSAVDVIVRSCQHRVGWQSP